MNRIKEATSEAELELEPSIFYTIQRNNNSLMISERNITILDNNDDVIKNAILLNINADPTYSDKFCKEIKSDLVYTIQDSILVCYRECRYDEGCICYGKKGLDESESLIPLDKIISNKSFIALTHSNIINCTMPTLKKIETDSLSKLYDNILYDRSDAVEELE